MQNSKTESKKSPAKRCMRKTAAPITIMTIVARRHALSSKSLSSTKKPSKLEKKIKQSFGLAIATSMGYLDRFRLVKFGVWSLVICHYPIL